MFLHLSIAFFVRDTWYDIYVKPSNKSNYYFLANKQYLHRTINSIYVLKDKQLIINELFGGVFVLSLDSFIFWWWSENLFLLIWYNPECYLNSMVFIKNSHNTKSITIWTITQGSIKTYISKQIHFPPRMLSFIYVTHILMTHPFTILRCMYIQPFYFLIFDRTIR